MILCNSHLGASFALGGKRLSLQQGVEFYIRRLQNLNNRKIMHIVTKSKLLSGKFVSRNEEKKENRILSPKCLRVYWNQNRTGEWGRATWANSYLPRFSGQFAGELSGWGSGAAVLLGMFSVDGVVRPQLCVRVDQLKSTTGEVHIVNVTVQLRHPELQELVQVINSGKR